MSSLPTFIAGALILASTAGNTVIAADSSSTNSEGKNKQSQSAQKKSSHQSHESHGKTTMDKARPATSGSGSAGGETGGPAATGGHTGSTTNKSNSPGK